MVDWFHPPLLSQLPAGDGDHRCDPLLMMNWRTCDLHFDPHMISIATKPPTPVSLHLIMFCACFFNQSKCCLCESQCFRSLTETKGHIHRPFSRDSPGGLSEDFYLDCFAAFSQPITQVICCKRRLCLVGSKRRSGTSLVAPSPD